MPTYYLNFEKFQVEDFFIVFLEWPNKLIFVPVYVKEDEIKFPILGKKSTGNWIMCALVGIAIILKWGGKVKRGTKSIKKNLSILMERNIKFYHKAISKKIVRTILLGLS